MVGRSLAARVLKNWTEDFVDEDTGEVVSIERTEVIIDRETVIENHHIDLIVESGAKTILLHRDDPDNIDFSIIFNTLQKIQPTLRRKLLNIFTGNCVMLSRLMKKLPVV